jgi:hypothetical protein
MVTVHSTKCLVWIGRSSVFEPEQNNPFVAYGLSIKLVAYSSNAICWSRGSSSAAKSSAHLFSASDGSDEAKAKSEKQSLASNVTTVSSLFHQSSSSLCRSNVSYCSTPRAPLAKVTK